jgi:FtsP/CotA-like multicopper oxidase with cupredoxin domain
MLIDDGLYGSLIRGVSLFHCDLLSHEDNGIMAKILFK